MADIENFHPTKRLAVALGTGALRGITAKMRSCHGLVSSKLDDWWKGSRFTGLTHLGRSRFRKSWHFKTSTQLDFYRLLACSSIPPSPNLSSPCSSQSHTDLDERSAEPSDERGDIVLEGCLTSIAAADERALWQFTEQGTSYIAQYEKTEKCTRIQANSRTLDNVAQDGGQVVAGDCGAAYAAQDGRSVWELQPNNQLELLRGGNYCLSQMGSKAGSSDVAKNSEVRSSHSRSADNDHAPSSAVDGKESTFWASQEFQKAAVPEAVLFDVDFGDKYKLRTTDIDWEFPPLSYSIATSLDGVNYAEVSRNDVNTSYTTLDDMKAVIAQYLRIRLQRPHPTMGVSNDMLVYGIKTLSVYSNRLRSIVEPCSKAKASADARDKFFLELVTEVDLSAGIELRRAGEIAASASASMAKSLSAVAEVSEPIKTCFEGKEAATLKLAALDAEVVDALGYLSVFEEGLTSSSESVAGATASSTMRGLSQEHPVEDCYTLKTLYNKATSGFYWVLPLCASQPLRAYCDISSGGTYATVPDNDSIVSLRDAVKACAKIGLEPIHLRTNRQLPALQRMLDIMEIDLTNPVPVAVNNGASVFYSLDFKKDVTEFIVPAQQGGALIGNTVGISPSGLIFFDSSETDMSTIICSTNKDAWNPPQSYIDVTCITAVGGNAAFDGPPGTTFFVRCPEGCIHYGMLTAEASVFFGDKKFPTSVDEAKVVGGEEGVYAEDSSICIAAIHAGLLSRGGDVSIRISPTPAEFEGTDKNGILSSSFFGHTDKRAFVVETVALQCPMDRSHSSSFLELGFSHSAKPPRDSGWPKLISVPAKTMQQLNAAPSQALSAASAAQSSAVIEEMNELTVMAINQLSTILSQQLGGLNMEVVEHIRLTATKSTWYDSLATSIIPCEMPRLSQALQRRAEQSATDEWSLDAVKNAELADMFHIFDSRLTSSAVTPTVPGSSGTGTYSIVKNKAFYDFVLAADIYISGSGSVGVAFRVKDRKNMFLFEMKQVRKLFIDNFVVYPLLITNVQQGNGGSKRLLRIVNGVPTETAKLEDGGYVEGIWYHVEVHGQLQRISVRVSEISENAPAAASKFDIDLLDGSFMSGSIGFYTSAVNSACFDKVAVTPLPCTGSKEKALLPPYPPRCSNYRESFVGRLSEEWEPSDPALADVPSHWKYAADVGGERITIAQMAPAILALGRHRSCEEGLFSFKFFPQCEEATLSSKQAIARLCQSLASEDQMVRRHSAESDARRVPKQCGRAAFWNCWAYDMALRGCGVRIDIAESIIAPQTDRVLPGQHRAAFARGAAHVNSRTQKKPEAAVRSTAPRHSKRKPLENESFPQLPRELYIHLALVMATRIIAPMNAVSDIENRSFEPCPADMRHSPQNTTSEK
ncbi:hypothetical protein Esti_004738 [Eimeria stiedai]